MTDIKKEKNIFKNYFLMVSCLFALIATIITLRSFNAVFYPILHVEDGTEMLAFYLNNPYPSEIFRFHMGYISLIPNAIGFLTTSVFPVHVVPYIMAAYSVALASCSLSIFSLRRFRFMALQENLWVKVWRLV